MAVFTTRNIYTLPMFAALTGIKMYSVVPAAQMNRVFEAEAIGISSALDLNSDGMITHSEYDIATALITVAR